MLYFRGISLAPKKELLCPFLEEQVASEFLFWRERKATIFISSVTNCSRGRMQGVFPTDAHEPVLLAGHTPGHQHAAEASKDYSGPELRSKPPANGSPWEEKKV